MVPRLLALSLAVAAAAGLSAPASPQPAPAAPPPPAKPVAPTAKTNYTESLKAVRVIEHKDIDPATGKKRLEKIPMAAKFDMVYVPGGECTVGSPDGEAGRDPNEGPAHRVKVGPFWMAKCEITWDAYDLFWYDSDYLVANEEKAKPLGPDAVTRPTNTFVDESYGHGRDGHPALCMTHHAGMAFCNWLRAKTGKAYRLPTEAEWEYAARGGKGDSAYFFGDDPAELDEYAWYKNNSKDEENFPDQVKGCTHKVGTRKPNPFGIHDLYGNVWEWTLDQYDPKAYDRFAAQKLSLMPVTVPTADKWSHVLRGGSWADKAERCRSAARRVSEKSWMKWDPQEPQSIWWLTKMDVVGLRVIVAEDEQPELAGLKPKVVKKSE